MIQPRRTPRAPFRARASRAEAAARTQAAPVARALLLLAALLLSPGCVSRTLAVTSDPAGARVTIDGKFVGTTPYEQAYHSYGTRSLDLELAGYTSRHELLDVPLPWWQVFPLDVVTDLLLPLGLHDDHAFHYALQPLDPEAGTWDEARAAYAREQADLAEVRRAEAAHAGVDPKNPAPDSTPPAAGDKP